MNAEFPNGASAAQAWLAAEPNHDFSQWEGVWAARSSLWEDLEKIIESVTGLTIGKINSHIRQACNTIVGQNQTKEHLTKQQKEAITSQAVTRVIAESNVEWKDHMHTWLQAALAAYQPRSITLWKKTVQNKKTNLENSKKTPVPMNPPPSAFESGATTNSIPSTPPYQHTSKPRKRRVSPAASVISASPTIRRRLGKKPISVGYPSSAFNTQGPVQIRLVDRNIEVRMCGLEGVGPEPNGYLAVAISAIVMENYRQLRNEDIRANHLDFSLFVHIVNVSDKRFDIRKLKLWCNDNLIRDQTDFLRAIGVEDTRLRALGMDTPVVLDLKSTRDDSTDISFHPQSPQQERSGMSR
jgi:hypothetical protein